MCENVYMLFEHGYNKRMVCRWLLLAKPLTTTSSPLSVDGVTHAHKVLVQLNKGAREFANTYIFQHDL